MRTPPHHPHRTHGKMLWPARTLWLWVSTMAVSPAARPPPSGPPQVAVPATQKVRDRSRPVRSLNASCDAAAGPRSASAPRSCTAFCVSRASSPASRPRSISRTPRKSIWHGGRSRRDTTTRHISAVSAVGSRGRRLASCWHSTAPRAPVGTTTLCLTSRCSQEEMAVSYKRGDRFRHSVGSVSGLLASPGAGS